MNSMTDLEMTRLCAEAMGFAQIGETAGTIWTLCHGGKYHRDRIAYQPLHDDAQAMALVKKFPISIERDPWMEFSRHLVSIWTGKGWMHLHIDTDLNRAIVECVAKMQAAKVKQCA